MNEEQKKKLDFYCGKDNWFETDDGTVRIENMRINDDFAIIRVSGGALVRIDKNGLVPTATTNGIKTSPFTHVPISDGEWLLLLTNNRAVILEDWMIQDTNLDDTFLVRLNRENFYQRLIEINDGMESNFPNQADFLDIQWTAIAQNKLTKSVIIMNFDKIPSIS